MTDELKAWAEERAYERAKVEYMENLDKIRAEIEDKRNVASNFDTAAGWSQTLALSWVLNLIDKYTKGESE